MRKRWSRLGNAAKGMIVVPLGLLVSKAVIRLLAGETGEDFALTAVGILGVTCIAGAYFVWVENLTERSKR